FVVFSKSLNTHATVIGLRVSGGLAFVDEASQSNAPNGITRVLDVDENYVFAGKAISSGTQTVQVWSLASPSTAPASYTFPSTPSTPVRSGMISVFTSA